MGKLAGQWVLGGNLSAAIRYVGIFLLLAVVCLQAAAQERMLPGVLKQQAIEQGLAQSAYWLALGHYSQTGLAKQHYRSAVDDPRFFLAARGDSNPQAELMATLDALTASAPSDSARDALCRFPARYAWLEDQLGFEAGSYRKPDCKLYQQWRSTIKPDSLVLVYASAHLNSPSSMYGHTLLRIDPPGFDADSPVLLSWAVNFGANVPANENSLLYAYRGIFGGYPGLFNVLPYYEKLKQYSRMENRDLWEYRLNLTQMEVDRVVRHLWELKDVNFDYFFFDENCSYRLLELLDIARPGTDIVKGYPLAVIPVDTVRGVIDRGFVESVTYRPSSATKLKAQISQINDSERLIAANLVDDITALEGENYQGITTVTQGIVANVAYGVTRYQVRKQARDPQVAENSFRLLKEINNKPTPSAPKPALPQQPNKGHESGAVTLMAGREAGDNYLDVDVRASFHDLLDNQDGYLPGSAINMGRIRFRKYEGGRFQLQGLEAIDIVSLTPRDEFFNPISWRTSTGLERQRTDGKDRLVAQANGGGGVTYQLGESLLFYAMATGRIEYNQGFADNWQIAPGAVAGLLYSSKAVSASLEAEGYKFFNGYDRNRYSATLHLPLAKDLGLRFSMRHNRYNDGTFNEGSLSLRWYF